MRSLFVVVTCLASTALCWAESCSENAAKRRAEIEADFKAGRIDAFHHELRLSHVPMHQLACEAALRRKRI